MDGASDAIAKEPTQDGLCRSGCTRPRFWHRVRRLRHADCGIRSAGQRRRLASKFVMGMRQIAGGLLDRKRIPRIHSRASLQDTQPFSRGETS